MTKRPKPVMHGRDHASDGPDPIPGLGAGGGIQFDTHPQDGDWLYVKTTGADPTSPAAGIALLAEENGIYIDAISGQLSLFADNGRVQLGSADDDVEITAALNIQATATQDMTLIAFRDFNVTAHRDLTFQCGTGRDLFLSGIPTSLPAYPNAVWNDGGTLKIS